MKRKELEKLDYDELKNVFTDVGGKIRATKKYISYKKGGTEYRAIRYPREVLIEIILK